MTDFANREIVDVAEEFNYDTQSEIYSMHFKKWRKNKNNPYAFNFEMNRKESVYIESKGFRVQKITDAESEILGNIARVISIGMLIWIFIDMFLSKLVIPLFHYLGMDIQTFFYSKSFHGGGIEIVTAMIIISILKTVIPIIYLNKKMRLPDDVRFMKTLNRQNNLIMAIALSVAASTVICLPNIYKDSNTTQLYRYFSSLEADTAAWGQTEYIVYIIFDIIILSVLVETLFRGSMFAALRQFGDWFAILITAVVSGLLVQDVKEFPAFVLISVIAGMGMLMTGSIYTAFFVRIIFKMYRFTIAILEADPSPYMDIGRNAFMFTAFVISVGAALIVHFAERDRNWSADYISESTGLMRAFYMFKAYPCPIVVCLCLLSAGLDLVM